MKKFIVFIILLASCGQTTLSEIMVAEWAKNPEFGGVMLLGDSITMRWPDELMPEDSYNRGIGGNTTKDVLDRFWLVEEESPDIIYILIGVNNLLDGKFLHRYVVPDIEEMINRLPDTEINIIGILPTTRVNIETVISTNYDIQKMLIDYPAVKYIDMFDAFYDGSILYMIDGIHPTDEGYKIMLDIINGE